MKTLLSVDWDYFTPEDPKDDLGHSETEVHLDMMWRARSGLLDKIKTDGEQEGFWDRIGGSLSGVGSTYVSDSHMHAYSLLRGVDHVILVDAHHDCWEEDSLGIETLGEGYIYCHNWLSVWLSKGRHRRVTWIQPEWSKGLYDVPKKLRKRVTVKSEIKGKIDRVHVCRSGCWTPPWLDKQFIKFVEDRKSLKINMQDERPWNPMLERWTEDDLQELRDQEAEFRDAMKRIKTGVMSSDSFINGKTELSIPA